MITRDAVGGAFPVRPLGEVVEFLDSKRRRTQISPLRYGEASTTNILMPPEQPPKV